MCATERFASGSVLLRPKVSLYGVVKLAKHPVTCVRALPGVRLTDLGARKPAAGARTYVITVLCTRSSKTPTRRTPTAKSLLSQ